MVQKALAGSADRTFGVVLETRMGRGHPIAKRGVSTTPIPGGPPWILRSNGDCRSRPLATVFRHLATGTASQPVERRGHPL
jgi:hypothetical protein